MPIIEQTWHAVIPVIPDDALLALPPAEAAALVAEREQAIRLEAEDPHRYGYDPAMWRMVDLHVAEMRLESPLAVLEILIMGGIRSAKTEFAAKRLTQHLFHFRRYRMRGDYVAWVWSLHENERASETIAQARIFKYLPAEWKTEKGSIRKTRTCKLNYTEGSGFTGEMFIVNNRLADFKMYGASDSTLQGAELTAAWSDELVPRSVVQTVKDRLNTAAKDTGTEEHRADVLAARARLQSGRSLTPEQVAQLYLGVHIVTFTPKEGYSATVADFLDGSRIIVEEPAELLPQVSDGGGVSYASVPRVRACRAKTRRVFYFHTKDNAFGNWDGLKLDLAGAKEEVIRITAYGDVRKAWASQFPLFRDSVHVIRRAMVPRTGTWYHRVDPCDGRNWFMTWWLVSGQRHYCVRQWPQSGDYIPRVGDPGAWAIASAKGKADGDQGPAQETFGFGHEQYLAEIQRVEREIGEWWGMKDGIPGGPITIFERSMDSRFGNAPTTTRDASTTLIEEMADLGMHFEMAPGEHQSEGIDMLRTLMSYDDNRPVSSLNCPRLYIVEDCEAVVYSFQNWTGKDGLRGASKDPLDTCRYHVLADPIDISAEDLRMKSRSGRGLS